MKKKQIGGAALYHARMEDVIPSIRFDHIFTDPPYLYIKTHDFDKEFDEALLFENARRILPDNGFIALFGRGTSFYRWNTRLAELGFVFKEEVVWNKRHITSPCTALLRVHETVSVHTKKTGKIRRSMIPYVEQKQHDIASIASDIKRIKSAINTEAGLNSILEFLNGAVLYKHKTTVKHGVSLQHEIKQHDDVVARMKPINRGMRERSIIELHASHLGMRHPTEKPVRLAERVIALISDPGDTIYDPFMGSGSFGVACINTGRKYIGSEIDGEYYSTACKRIKEASSNNELFELQGGIAK
jgi:site-specific DNA-methyltransferase (adenine-specific)